MNPASYIPEDLILIMESHVDLVQPSRSHSDGSSRLGGHRSKGVVGERIGNQEWSEEEDEVEMAIQVESDGECLPENSGSSHVPTSKLVPTTKRSEEESSSDSDSDSSTSSSDVEMRVTRYPVISKAKHLASLTALIKPSDSDAEDEDDVAHGSSVQYAGTKNEILAPKVEVPDITEVPPDDVLEPIGEIMTIIDSVVVVKGNTTGVYLALDTDSLLVFDDRKVLGKVFETFGAVKQPLYSIRFPSASLIDKNAVWIGRPVFHVPARSNFVFTEAIARIKGSDASNLHDEEVAEDQMEFSDDEAEAQWRRNRKEAKRGQASDFNRTQLSVTELTPKQTKLDLPAILPYPAADDGDVPYSTLPYDDVPDPRPVPAAYDPYSDHEEDPKPLAHLPLPPRPLPSSPQQNRNNGDPGGSRGKGRDRGRDRGSLNQNQDRRGRKHNGSGERGRPNRGRGNNGRGRGRGARQSYNHGQDSGFFPDNQRHREPSPTSLAISHATGQLSFPSVPHGYDEGYNPVNASNSFFEPPTSNAGTGTMPHINPRFFSGDMGMGAGEMNTGFGIPWGNMNNMTSHGYGYQQPELGYSGYDQTDGTGYYNNQGYGWPFGEQFHGQYEQSHDSHRESQDES